MAEPLLHFSSKPLGPIHSALQIGLDQFKPCGLWVSAGVGEDSWPAWCRGERYAQDRFAHATEVVLRPKAPVLRIGTVAELDAFDERYRRSSDLGSLFVIDRPAVAAAHAGIIIAPYQWTRRFYPKRFWYCAWDCASGCIWDAGAIAALTPRPDVVRALTQ